MVYLKRKKWIKAMEMTTGIIRVILILLNKNWILKASIQKQKTKLENRKNPFWHLCN